MSEKMETIPQFGARVPGVEYVDRPGAYTVIVNDAGLVALIRVRDNYHLPGGGCDSGESPADAALRETHEEIGVRPQLQKLIGRANQYVASPKTGEYYNKLCTYYRASVDARCEPSPCAEHSIAWAEPSTASRLLSYQSHAWAVGSIGGS